MWFFKPKVSPFKFLSGFFGPPYKDLNVTKKLRTYRVTKKTPYSCFNENARLFFCVRIFPLGDQAIFVETKCEVFCATLFINLLIKCCITVIKIKSKNEELFCCKKVPAIMNNPILNYFAAPTKLSIGSRIPSRME
jgi:hypothetical protein